MIIIRKKSKKCFIGSKVIGEEKTIAIQSMTNTPTCNTQLTLQQCIQFAENEVDFIRITVPTVREVEAIKQIIQQFRLLGYEHPIIADVHFNAKIAETLPPFVDKIRINPGNFIPSLTQSTPFDSERGQQNFDSTLSNAKKLLATCKEYGTAIRIGTNHGSLSQTIVEKYGNTPLAMVAATTEWIDICEYHQFQNFVLSLKASNVKFMLDSYKLLTKEMEKRKSFYPLHIGVTEAGNGMEGRAKSAAGIGALLLNGIGDTIRVSLTENPIHEILFAKKILQALDEIEPQHYVVDEQQILHFHYHEPDSEKFLAALSAICAFEHDKNPIKDIAIQNNFLTTEILKEIKQTVLQAVGIKFYKAEFISCPSCGRTKFDIEKVTEKVKAKFSTYCGLKIGIMGCIVNGPGEMADANYGVVGAGRNKLVVYKGKNAVSSVLPTEEALNYLEEIIQRDLNAN